MNKHDRPKLSKLHWHYIIIDEGHRIKNASCKLNADLKHYHSSHRLLLTGTPLQVWQDIYFFSSPGLFMFVHYKGLLGSITSICVFHFTSFWTDDHLKATAFTFAFILY